MVLNSTVTANSSTNEEAGANNHHLVVNTTDFNNRDFDDFVAISEEIERNNRQRRSQRRSRSNTMVVATMTREELFESTNLDDDQFLNALEHQNSYKEDMDKAAMLSSIDNLMKYFDEDVSVGDSSLKATPTKIKTRGKVASAMASLRSKAVNMTPSPLSKRKNKQKLEVKTNIQELKKCYELTPEPDSGSKSTKSLKMSPKFLRKSKVKQMAMLFNTKMHAIMRKDSPEPRTPEPLSPGLESIASPNFTSTLKPKSPKLKPKLPTFIAKLPSPKPSPLFKRRQLQRTPSISSLSSASPATKRKQLQRQPSTTCLVAESVFSQLSVKDKALLYNKFIEDMSKKNPKFSKHGQVLENNVQKEIARGEVVCEKQGTVKNIRDSLEAKFTPTKALSKTLQRFKRSPPELSLNVTPIAKSKEFEDIIRVETPETPSTPLSDDSEDPLHVSTLTVILKPSPESKKYATNRPRNSRKKRDVRFRSDLGVIEPSFKRTQNMIRSSVNIEPFAPPKKIRRTQHERLAPKMFFQNQHLEKLFYNWLKEKNGVVFDITPVHNKSDVIEIVPKNSRDNVIPKDKIDQLLEEAINKLEAQKNPLPASTKASAINIIKETLEEEKSLEKSVIEVELPLEVEMPPYGTTTKESLQEDSDMGVTSITKTTSEDSYTDIALEKDSLDISQNTSSLKSSNKTLRKKKLRRSLTWKKDNSLVESNPIFSTDSESDCRSLNNKSLSGTLPKTKKCSAYVKKLLFKTINSSISSEQTSANTNELSITELDRSLIRQINSPSKIKTAYTLTVMSSPSPPTESDFCDSDLPPTPMKDVSRSWPSLLEACHEEDDDKLQLKTKSVSTEFTDLAKNKLELDHHRVMVDSFIDLGFETGSNDMDSPMRMPRKSPPPKLSQDVDKSLMKRENPKNFSTPNKDKPLVQVFTAQLGDTNTSAQQHLISPIPLSTSMPRQNLTMQVIKEDYSSEETDQLPNSYNDSESYFTSEATNNSSAPPLGVTHKVETSQFWISCGDFTAAMNIHFYEAERLMLLSSIFGQKCLENRDMTFGIDEHRFSLDNSVCSEELLKKIPHLENCSQYWFATGDVLLPFSGKQMSTQKIQTFFSYIQEFMAEDMDSLRFGIDTYEFSNNCQTPTSTEFSHTWTSGTPIKTSDLDQSDLESVELEQSLTFSALGSNQSDSGSLKSEELVQANQTYRPHEECESLEQIFEDARHLNLSKTHTDKLALEAQFTVPEMLKTLQNQQYKLKCLEERMISCAKPSSSGKSMDQFNESPEYMRKLRSIIAAIDNIGRGNGFNACSIEQLESFMFFLSRYADLCLANCTAHIEKILDVVMNQRSFQA